MTFSRQVFLLFFFLLLFLSSPSISSLNSDGVLLLSFKYSILNDPLSALASWNYDDDSPCSWNGVICSGFVDPLSNCSTTLSRVTRLVLPNSQLLGSISSDLLLVEHLRHLDLSNNFLNGSLPNSLFNSSTELRVLDLSNNEISGGISELVERLTSLQVLNLSDNALVGRVPENLTHLPNLTVLSLSNNYLSGSLPTGGFDRLRVLDLSSNLVDGSIPVDFGVNNVQYLNLSYNKISGEIPSRPGSRIPPDAIIDLSFNNLSGGIPQSAAFLAQKPLAFEGNPGLCGKPLKNLCTIPSSLSNPPLNASIPNAPKSPPAFAAIPKTTTSTNGSSVSNGRQGGFKPATIAAIVIGDLGGIGLLFVVFLYAYHVRKKKMMGNQNEEEKKVGSLESKGSSGGLACCLRKKDSDGEEETTETSSSSDAEEEEELKSQGLQNQQEATLVTVDGDAELEMETLLKASAYILGATGSTIVYKAVLTDGTALAVRRIGDSNVIDKLKDFEGQVRSIAKFRHPNLLRIWGFYWGPDEKLLIHDYAANGSLANISFNKKLRSSLFHLNWEARLRIARGIARGLAYIHEKKSMHGNVKPSNILLDSNMEAKIGDFGLDRLLFGDSVAKQGNSARLFGSKRSMQSQTSLQELSPIPSTTPLGSTSNPVNPYQAPESLKNLKPNARWDVYSFGIVLLELMAGRVFLEEELCQWNAGFVVDERNRIMRMADPALRGKAEGKDALLSCFKLGFACASNVPQRRPTMKDVVMLLDRIPSTSSSSCC